MMFEQRSMPPEPTADVEPRTWLSDEPGPIGDVVRRGKPGRLWYAVVDDITEDPDGAVLLEIAGWPAVDGHGRLVFGAGTNPDVQDESLGVDRRDLQEVLDEARDETGQAQRPIRIGDTFMIVADPPVSVDAGTWDEVLDVSAAARDAAKIAFNAAAITPVTQDEVEVLSLEPPVEQRDLPYLTDTEGTATPGV